MPSEERLTAEWQARVLRSLLRFFAAGREPLLLQEKIDLQGGVKVPTLGT